MEVVVSTGGEAVYAKAIGRGCFGLESNVTCGDRPLWKKAEDGVMWWAGDVRGSAMLTRAPGLEVNAKEAPMAGKWGTVVQPSVKVTALRSDWSTVKIRWERATTKRNNKQKKAVTCTVAMGK